MSKQKDQKPGCAKILDAWIPSEDAGDPIGCVATSFTFSPVLFEEDCLGRFLQLETDATEDGPAYLVEREEKLSQLICAAALVDQHHARGVRSLRWDLLPARLSPGILHAKVSLLLWSRCARLIVASANLTEDGYRRNCYLYRESQSLAEGGWRYSGHWKKCHCKFIDRSPWLDSLVLGFAYRTSNCRRRHNICSSFGGSCDESRWVFTLELFVS